LQVFHASLIWWKKCFLLYFFAEKFLHEIIFTLMIDEERCFPGKNNHQKKRLESGKQNEYSMSLRLKVD